MRKLKWLSFLFVFLFLGFFLFRNEVLVLYSRLILFISTIQTSKEKQITELIKEARKEIFTPEPLRAKKENSESFLTSTGVIEWTNIQRKEYGLLPLRENKKLTDSAQKKLQDMFDKQYFAHVSPSGIEVKDLAESVGYQFIAIGENLALGNFKDDQILVNAWMESPGHRQNILNPKYQEIGVAVGKGEFEGKITWLAVQHFGLSISACPQIDETLKLEIERNESELKVLEMEIRSIKVDWRRAINKQEIEEYNNLVLKYNNLLAETKSLINQYNNQVKLFNECVVR